MWEKPEICQTCLSSDRYLRPVITLSDLLKKCHIEIKNMEGSICWECCRLLEKFSNFKAQVSNAQRLLKDCYQTENLKPFTALTISTKHYHYSNFDKNADIRLTCTETGPILIKKEIGETVDVAETADVVKTVNESGTIDVAETVDVAKTVDVIETVNVAGTVNIHRVERNGNKEIVIDEAENNESYTNSTRADDSGEHNISDNMLSELPRITLVESIVEQPTVPNKETQPVTEIIELNIPIPTPTAVVDDPKTDNELTEPEPTDLGTDNNVIQIDKAITKKDIITVKVSYKGNLQNGTEVKIKEEPLSDHEDVQFDSEEIINVSRESGNSVRLSTSVSIVKVEDVPDKEDEKYKLWVKSAMLVYSSLRDHKYAHHFLCSITDSSAPDYSILVKQPMDLSTIRRNIKSGAIRTTAELQRHLLLMLSNALMYNSSNHYIYDVTKDFFEEVQNQLNLLLTVHENSVTVDNTPSERPRRRRCFENYITDTPAKRPRNAEKAKPLISSNKVIKKPNVKKKKTTPILIPKLEKVEKYNNAKIKKETQKRTRKSKKKVTFKTPKVEKINYDYNETAPNKGRLPSCSNSHNIPKEIDQEPTLPLTAKIKQEIIQVIRRSQRQRNRKEKEEEDSVNINIANDDDDLSVAITKDSRRDLTKTEATYLKKTLEDEILTIAMHFGKFAPRFRGKPIIVDGVIKLLCEDKKTLKWLIKVIADLPVEIGKFLVVRQADLPKKIKSALLIPNIGGNGEVSIILKILTVQNPWARVESWVSYSAELRGEDVFLVLGIPSTVIPTLMRKGRRLAYILGSVYVKFYSNNGQLCDNPPVVR